MKSTIDLQTATLVDVVRYAILQSIDLGLADRQLGMSIEDVERRITHMFEEASVQRRVTDVGTVLADHTGQKGHGYFRRVKRGVYTIA